MYLFIILDHDKMPSISDIYQEMNELREKYSKSQRLIQTLQHELTEQKRKEKENVEKNVQEILSSVFTAGQIKMLMFNKSFTDKDTLVIARYCSCNILTQRQPEGLRIFAKSTKHPSSWIVDTSQMGSSI